MLIQRRLQGTPALLYQTFVAQLRFFVRLHLQGTPALLHQTFVAQLRFFVRLQLQGTPALNSYLCGTTASRVFIVSLLALCVFCKRSIPVRSIPAFAVYRIACLCTTSSEVWYCDLCVLHACLRQCLPGLVQRPSSHVYRFRGDADLLLSIYKLNTYQHAESSVIPNIVLSSR